MVFPMDKTKSLRERELRWWCLAPDKNGLLGGLCGESWRWIAAGHLDATEMGKGKVSEEPMKVPRERNQLPTSAKARDGVITSKASNKNLWINEYPSSSSRSWKGQKQVSKMGEEKKGHERRKERWGQELFSPWPSNFRLLACGQPELEKRHFNCKLKLKLQQFFSGTAI